MKTYQRNWAMLAIATTALTVRAADPQPAAANWAAVRDETFQVVWQTVNDAYFDPTFGGVDWQAVGKSYRERLVDIGGQSELRGLLRAMLGELKRTHFNIVPREAAVFAPAERTRIGTLGVTVAWVGNELTFATVVPDSAAWRAGVRPGDAIGEVDGVVVELLQAAMLQAGYDESHAGQYLAQIVGARMSGAVGGEIYVRSRRGADEFVNATMKFEPHDGPWSEPLGNFPSMPVACQSERGDDGIGYLRFNTFAPAIMREVRTFLKSLKREDGLIIDLRGNPGGVGVMAPSISGWLMARETSLGTMKLRQGVMHFPVYPQEGAFLGPVAVLIDGGSASTSEILAAGLHDLGRARLFGERSAGAALPSAFKSLPTGDLFQFAIADVQTPKAVMLEGNGVQPDEVVALSRADLAVGRDTVRETAREWLMRVRQAGKDRASQATPGR